jgi:hypothetical protein
VEARATPDNRSQLTVNGTISERILTTSGGSKQTTNYSPCFVNFVSRSPV